MTDHDKINLSLFLPQNWWCRLQRIAQTCYASPSEFVREIIEAEIVRRELLLEESGELNSRWCELLNTPTSSPVQ
jgi:metal-responsive CopG/Arc/MetJ family transcriptional regulator